MNSLRSVSVFSSAILLSTVINNPTYASNEPQLTRNAPTAESASVIMDGAALEYNIRWDNNAERYRVFMKPLETPAPDQSMTAQITIKVPHATGVDQFQVSALTSTITDTSWSDDSRANAPAEDESADYLSFSLNINRAGAFNWQANQEIEVFNFANSGTCIGPVAVMNNDTDPFIIPVNNGGTNSINSNPGNQFSNLGWNIEDIAGNDYAGNYGNPADCSGTLDSDNDGLSNLIEETIGSDPNNPDSDQDGISDGIEAGKDAQNPQDTDGDGTLDLLDTDDDNDGLLTRYEKYNAGTPGDDDSDSDGIADYLDSDDDGDGKPTQNELADPNGDGKPDDANDQNNDGIPDYLDDKVADKTVLQVKGILQGAYNGNTQLMRDDLKQQGLLPIAQPFEDSNSLDYMGIEVIANELLTTDGDDAPVDWVLVELLDASDRETRIATRAAILQRDGDVMDAITGSTDLEFSDVPPGNYFVGLNHRNHLGVVSLNPINLSENPTMVDFSRSSEPVYGDNARYVVNNLAMLWAGEADNNNSIISSGPGNDVTVLLGKVLTANENAFFNSNFRMLGYSNADFNLDGMTLFAGPNNDTNVVMGNVLLHPENNTFSANYVVRGRKPKHKWPEHNKNKR